MKVRNFALILSLAVLLSMTSAFAQTKYNYQTLDFSGDTFTQLLGVNGSGDIAGYHNFTANQGFVYHLSTGKFDKENVPNSQMTQVIGINGEPYKTSGFFMSASGRTEGFTDYKGHFNAINFPNTQFNQLLSQNDKGQAAGYYSTKADGTGPDHAYIVDEFGLVFELFVIPGSVSAQATGINNLGEVVGFTIDNKNNTHGWLKSFGKYTQLDYPGAVSTQALGLNGSGLVVGSFVDSQNMTHGFVYNSSAASYVQIDDPNGFGETIVNGINDKGILVGFYGPSACTTNNCNGFIATPSE